MKSRSLVFAALLAITCLGVALGYLHRQSRVLPPVEAPSTPAREAEIAFLQAEIYRGEVAPLTRRVDAYDRFSSRC